jgi:hypothetical protein
LLNKRLKPFRNSRLLSEELPKRNKGARSCGSAGKKKRRDEGWPQLHLHEEPEEPEELEGSGVPREHEAEPPPRGVLALAIHPKALRRAYRALAVPQTLVEDLVRAERGGLDKPEQVHLTF